MAVLGTIGLFLYKLFLYIGIDSMLMIIEEKKTVKHLKYEW